MLISSFWSLVAVKAFQSRGRWNSLPRGASPFPWIARCLWRKWGRREGKVSEAGGAEGLGRWIPTITSGAVLCDCYRNKHLRTGYRKWLRSPVWREQPNLSTWACLEGKGNQQDFFKRFPTPDFWISNKLWGFSYSCWQLLFLHATRVLQFQELSQSDQVLFCPDLNFCFWGDFWMLSSNKD